MTREEDAVWAAILKSKERLESSRRTWFILKFAGLTTQFLFAIIALVSNLGWGDMLRFIITGAIVVMVNELIQLVFAKVELSTARAEAELAHRVDGLLAATQDN